MSSTVEPLGPSHVAALRALLAKDPVHNLYLLGVMEEFGVVCQPDRAQFAFWGRFLQAELTAVVFVGGAGGLVIPSASLVNAITDIAKALQGKVSLKSCIGEKSLVDALAHRLAGPIRFSKVQRLFSVSADDLGPFTNPMVRLATEADLEQLVPIAAACVKEMLQRDPLAEDSVGFHARVKQRVKTRRTYVLEDGGRLIFKIDVGSRSQYGAELEGLYTIPEERRRGHATLCLGQMSRFLLSSLPRLTIRVDDTDSGLAELVRKVGFHPQRQQRLVWTD